jgi:hypothetical protein
LTKERAIGERTKLKKQTDMGGLLHGPHHTRAAREIEGRRRRNCSCSSPNS